MNKPILTTLLCLVLCSQAFAQQLPLLSQLQESAGVLNPAAVPSAYMQFGHNLQIVATHHNQWAQLEGHPRTSQVAGTLFLDEYEGVAPLVGAYAIHDQTGPSGFTGLYGKIAGVITGDAYEGGLSLGLQAGVNQYRLNISELVLRDEETLYAAEDANQVSPDVGVGIFAYKRLDHAMVYVGFSAPQLLGLNLNFQGADGNIASQRYRHYYAQLGGLMPLGDDGFIEPAAIVRFVPGVPINVRATARYQSAAALFVGLGGSSSRSAHGEIGFTLGDRDSKLFRIGYGFDYAFRSYGSYAGATHELNLSYSFTR